MPQEEKSFSQILVSSFDNGQISDLDESKVKNTSFMDASNVKLFDLRGHGLVITNINGNNFSIDSNESNKSIGFIIREDFVPLGACVYNGIMFLISCKNRPEPNTKGYLGEIGSFPSLNEDGVFERKYRPLMNFDDGDHATGGEFNTILLNLDITKQIEIVPWENIDGSINLCFTDNLNPLRVINCGFDCNGTRNDKIYQAKHFPNIISCIPGTGKTLLLDEQTIGSGGALKFGNTFFYFRYADWSFTPTHFVAESEPAQIYDGDLTIGGAQGALSGFSNRKVTFQLSGLDFAFKYIQVAYLRFFSGEEGQVSYECGIIDRDYPLPAETESYLRIEITGNEGNRIIPIEEIIANRIEEDVVRTITVGEKRLWGASWKGDKNYDDSMLEFAQLVKIRLYSSSYNATKWSGHENDTIVLNTSTSMGDYKDPAKTGHSVGYFRTEAYPFALRFELNNGYLTIPVPIIGFDEWQYDENGGTIVSHENAFGIFRFPGYVRHPIFSVVDGQDTFNRFGVRVDFKDAITQVKATMSGDSLYWIKQNVRSIQIVRGERHKTIEYQGIAIQGAKAETTELIEWRMTQAATIRGITNPTGVEVVALDQQREWESNAGTLRQSYGFYANVNYQNLYWGASGHVGNIIQNKNVVATSNLDVSIPLFRFYAPMMYTTDDNRSDGDFTVANKDKERNYMSRWFADKEHLGVFSPDFLFQPIASTENIKMISRVGKTIPSYTDYVADGINASKDKWNVNETSTTDSSVYPRWSIAEITGGLTYSVLNDTQIKVAKVGENADILPQAPILSMVNKTKDFFASDLETLFYASHNDDARIWSNRSIRTPKFIAIERTNVTDADQNFNLDIVNLYNTTSPLTETITSYFPNLATVSYSKIGKPIVIDWETINPANYTQEIRSGGDCFLQRTYIKTQAWAGTAFNGDNWEMLTTYDEDAVDNHNNSNKNSFFTHGLILGIVTENAINTSMRGIKDEHLYYPFVRSAVTFANRSSSEAKSECFDINRGYSKTTGLHKAFGYDPRFPILDKRKKVRIRYSDICEVGSFYSGYRTFRPNNKKDFELTSGEIIKLIDFNDYLVSVQERSISLHYLNERAMVSDPNNPGFVFGKGDVISDKVRVLADYGSQHQWGVLKAGSIFGVDVNRRIIWTIADTMESTGYRSIKAVDLTDTKLCSKYINELMDSWSTRGDITGRLGDTPIDGEGVMVQYDPKNKEVFFVFTNNQVSVKQILIDGGSNAEYVL